MSLPAPGTVLAAKYEIVRTLGRGGMGVVFEARHLKLQQPVAIKFLRDELLGNPESTARFEREARAAARLTSPHTARIYDVDATADGAPFMVMEYLEGRDLATELAERRVLPIAEAVDWVLQACAAMAEAHSASIVHRDLKPSNLFLCENVAGGPLVKVLDFGISKITIDLDENLTAHSTVLGTPHYMSPEQVTAGKLDGRSDLWALAVLLYRTLTAEFPFHAPNATALAVSIATERPTPITDRMPLIPDALARAIMRGLERSLEDRHPNVIALAAAIEPFGSGRWAVPHSPTSAKSNPRAHTPSSPRLPSLPSLPAASADAPEGETRSTWGKTAPSASRFGPRAALVAGVAAMLLAAAGTAGFIAIRRATSGSSGSSGSAATASETPSAALTPPRVMSATATPLDTTAPTPTAPGASSASPSATGTVARPWATGRPTAGPPPVKSAPAPTVTPTATSRPTAPPTPSGTPLHI